MPPPISGSDVHVSEDIRRTMRSIAATHEATMRATCYDSQRPGIPRATRTDLWTVWLPWPKRSGLHFGPASATLPSAYVGRADAMTELEQLFWLVAVSAASVIAILVWTAVLLEGLRQHHSMHPRISGAEHERLAAAALRLRRDYEEGRATMSKTIQGFHRAGVAAGWERVTDDAGTTQYLPAVQPQRRQPPMLVRCCRSATEPAALLHAWQQPTEAHLERTNRGPRKGVVRRRRRCCCWWRCWRWPGQSSRSAWRGLCPPC